MGTTLEKPTLQNLKTYPIADAFEMSKQAIAELSDRYMSLGIEPDGSGRQEVHEALMDIVKRRTGVKKTGKALRDDVNKFRTSVISFENELVDLMTPIETYLRTTRDKYDAEVERRKQEAEEARQEALKAKVHELAKYGHVTTAYEVDAMTDTVYAATLEEAKQAHAEKLEREAAEKAEQERLENLERERQEAERQKVLAEEKRLKAEHERIAKVTKRLNVLAGYGVNTTMDKLDGMSDEEFATYLGLAKSDYEAKKEAEAEAAARQEAEARKLREEREALEAEKARILEEKAEAERKAELERREKEAAERAAQAERERIEREQAEAKAKEEAEEAERKRQEALRPDREKLEALADRVEALDLPTLSKGMESISISAHEIVLSCANGIRELALGMMENQEPR